MMSYDLTELARKAAEICEDAAWAPVTLTAHDHPRFVIMSSEDYKALTHLAQHPRRAYLLEDIPRDEAELFNQALDRIIASAADD